MSRILGVHAGKILAQWNKTATNDMRHSMNSFGEKASRMKPEITAVSCGPTHLQETIRTQARSRTTVMDTIAWHSAVRCYSTGATVDYELLYSKEREDHQETKKNLEKKNKEIGTLEAQLAEQKKLVFEYRLLLGIRSKIESLEDRLWPIGKKKGKISRTEVWTHLLKSSAPEFDGDDSIREFRNRLNRDADLSADFFIEKIIKPIYKQTSDIGAHKVKVPPVEELSDEIIVEMLELIGLTADRAYIVGLKIILEPLKSVG